MLDVNQMCKNRREGSQNLPRGYIPVVTIFLNQKLRQIGLTNMNKLVLTEGDCILK